VEKNDGETKILPSSLAEALFIMGSTASAGMLLRRRKKEFGLGWSFKRLQGLFQKNLSSSSLCSLVIPHMNSC
jgi:hypothetical protein